MCTIREYTNSFAVLWICNGIRELSYSNKYVNLAFQKSWNAKFMERQIDINSIN